jgi:hypothetical protein
MMLITHSRGVRGVMDIRLSPKGLFGKWRNQVDGRGLKGILGNFDL